MEKTKVVLILLVVLVLASAGSLYDNPSASAQVVTSGEPAIYFLKLDGIEGESTHSLHEDELVITSYSWEESSSGVMHLGGGGGRAAAEIEDFYFTAPLSKASPKLMQSVPQGNDIDWAVFTVRKATESQPVLLEVKLDGVNVTGYHTSSIGYRPTESFSLNFGKITYTYYVYDEQGNFVGTIEGGWNVEANKPLDSQGVQGSEEDDVASHFIWVQNEMNEDHAASLQPRNDGTTGQQPGIGGTGTASIVRTSSYLVRNLARRSFGRWQLSRRGSP